MPAQEAYTTLNIFDKPMRWKNLVFRKDGTSSYGRMTWDTKEAAREEAENCDREMEKLAALGQPTYIITIDGNIYWDEYSHTEQVPHP